jgi:hypothetical protein
MALIKGPDMYTLGVAFFAAIGTFLFGQYWKLSDLSSLELSHQTILISIQASTPVSLPRPSHTKAG